VRHVVAARCLVMQICHTSNYKHTNWNKQPSFVTHSVSKNTNVASLFAVVCRCAPTCADAEAWAQASEASAQAFKAMAHRSEKDGSLPDRMNRSDGSYPQAGELDIIPLHSF